MAYRILVVDDSTFFRRRIKQILELDAELEVVGEAKNGVEAIASAATLKPDVITMDVEMPVMDGITAVKKVMAQSPVPIIMFSSITQEGAQATLDALDAGALDFIPKNFEDIALNRAEAVSLLQNRVKSLAKNNKTSAKSNIASGSVKTRGQIRTRLPTDILGSKYSGSLSKPLPIGSIKNYACLAIGASTGGPVALQQILTELPKAFPVPVIIVQHMPGTFTEAFAKRLDEHCQVKVREAQNGDLLQKGVCYLAPGGKHMTVSGSNKAPKITISDPSAYPTAAYKPSVDITFDSLAKVYAGDVLAVILTGMGADGKEGCRTLKNKGATIWAQNKESCVVYGMPQAVAKANIAEESFDIAAMATNIKKKLAH
ncbi:chemotaxis response regulator protein-glutamate methylesterase [Paraglaciecola aquimarina]|uniref:Protein-glutamate methylesterase/protein-glutamine glutaminase n=1 Tax=Paraglaciecola algarum TaxID=3050085 RepID=A0ABS9DDV3_9ALTE|nr:chemotaxis response regulator protein-glutamate methylesterase [Paraglaciecola sp. G1-23]MCF2950197.1 chemotaxis response regulator protein-glutamate methylesterase [Paraglaciecola sp. G1-23]